MFNQDPYPGKPKILFIGNPTSSHVRGWINLLSDTRFNVRLFACADGYPPANWMVKTYVITKYPPEGLDPEWRESWWPEPEKWYEYNEKIKHAVETEQARDANIVEHNEWLQTVNHINEEFMAAATGFELNYHTLINDYNNLVVKQFNVRNLLSQLFYWIKYQYVGKRKKEESQPNEFFFAKNHFSEYPKREAYPPEPQIPPTKFPIQEPLTKALSPSEWLADVIKSWQPDIIHTFGLDEGSIFYANARKDFQLEHFGKWVIKIFGGSDVALKIYDQQDRQMMADLFSEATHVLFDNLFYANILQAEKLLQATKICPLTPLPGSGGVDVDNLIQKWSAPPSARRVIVWPKSYETIWSKALPVLFALKNIWEQIQPCDVYMLATNAEVKRWIPAMPIDMRTKLHVFEGVSREAVLDIMVKSRIMLAPSLIDGVPNTIYEAMACGALPIVSPLPSIMTVVKQDNVLFAENLDQPGLEKIILKVMTSDSLVDEYAYRNVELVKRLADRKMIQQKVIEYYESLVN